MSEFGRGRIWTWASLNVGEFRRRRILRRASLDVASFDVDEVGRGRV